jgi:hypothetical protein
MILRRIGLAVAAVSLSVSLIGSPDVAYAGKKERNIALGVGLGLLGGLIVSNGDPKAALGGAVAGGVIGGATAKDKNRDNRRSWRDDRRDWHRGPPPRHHQDHPRQRPRY